MDKISAARANISLPTDVTSQGPEEARESRIDAPKAPPTTEELASKVKVAERGSWDAKRTLEFVKRNADPSDGKTPREVGECKTVVSGVIGLVGGLAALASGATGVGPVLAGAAAKAAGDGVAAEVCDKPEAQ